MKRIVVLLIIVSVPLLLMARVFQAYRYTVMLETAEGYEVLQKQRLDENKKLLAAIAIFSAPGRVYKVGTEDLGLKPAEAENVMHVKFVSEEDM